MSSNYTGSFNQLQSPGPLPSPDNTPESNLPADGDPLAASSVAQAMKEPLDWIDYFNKSVRFYPPLTPASGASGYTAVTHVGAGTGTVVPQIVLTGTVVTGGWAVVIKIIAGGAVGAATFQWSNDGGATFSATQTTAATFTDSTSNITVTFTGTFSTNDTYSFRVTDNPVLATVNSQGNLVQKFDHTGYFIDRTERLEGKWYTCQSIGSTTATIIGDEDWSGISSSTTGTIAGIAPYTGTGAYPAPSVQISAGTTNGDKQWVCSTNTLLHGRFPSINLCAVMEGNVLFTAAGASTKCDWYWCLHPGVDPSASLTDTVGFAYLDGDANFQLLLEGSGANPLTYPISANTWYRLRIELYYTTTPFGAAATRYFINNQLIYAAPGATTTPNNFVRPIFGQKSKTGIGSVSARFGRVVLVWNKYISTPEL